MDSLLAHAGVVALLLAANAFFVAAEFSLVAARRTRIEAMIRRGDAKAKLVRRAFLSLDRSLAGTQLGITAASLGLGWTAEATVARLIESALAWLPAPLAVVATHGAAAVLAFVLVTFLQIVLSELAPRAVALLYPETTSRWLTGPLILWTTATNPFIWLVKSAANLGLRAFGLRLPKQLERLHSPEELRMLVEQSHKAGTLDRTDARLLTGVFEFSEKDAREVMTPRTQIVALPVSATLAEAADRIAAATRSRYPVYRGSLDDIAGIVYAKDVLAALRQAAPPPDIGPLVRPAHFVPGSREVEDVLADMKLLKQHMAIVLDEFGGTAGLVTMEDLLEEIVGQIEDEYDRPGRRLSVAPAGTTSFSGGDAIGEVNQRLGLALAEDDYTTLGGYLFGALGRLPKVGDRVPVDGGTFEVTAMEGRRVGEARYVKREK